MSLTPMMRQYLEIKEKYEDTILFYRLGDFYEMFMEDAKTASSILEIALTGRDGGLAERIPMCGIPYHAANSYIKKLIDKGYKVAICEQVEDPKTTKGIVKREVVQIITPGTMLEEGSLKEKENLYIGSIMENDDSISFAYADLSTGEFKVSSQKIYEDQSRIYEEIKRLELKELVVSNLDDKNKYQSLVDFITIYQGEITAIGDKVEIGLTMVELTRTFNAALLLYSYLDFTKKGNLSFIDRLDFYSLDQHMVMDTWTRKNLELTKSLRSGDAGNSLLGILDKTKTAFGGRLLKKWLEEPLLSLPAIEERLNIVNIFFDKIILNQEIREALKYVYDIERILGRLDYGNNNPKEMLALKKSLINIMKIKNIMVEENLLELAEIVNGIKDQNDLIDLIDKSISDDAPFTLKEEGVIKEGYNDEIDYLRQLTKESKNFIKDLETAERDRLGVKSLKISYNKVFGYYIELTKANAHLAPPEYIRKQTLASSERYINQELKELEYKLLNSRDKLRELEYEMFLSIRQAVLVKKNQLKEIAFNVARLDVLTSFAYVANLNDYVRPEICESQVFKLIDGRHPVVEKLMSEERYIPNDFDFQHNNLAIITGPNMAGKSTFIRMVAILTIMAQCGSFVPASSFKLGLVDRVFARVGASDDLSSGQSTFMVEMNEVASIIKNGTENSLIILDEVGRGTSTLDGLSIAWSVSEYLLKVTKARTVFATHYHELIELENEYNNIINLSMAVQEYPDEVVFLRKVVLGGGDKSYGIHVAKMAGLPEEIIARAEELIEHFEGQDIQGYVQEDKQIAFNFVEKNNKLKDILNEINPNNLTPINALELIYKLKKLSEE